MYVVILWRKIDEISDCLCVWCLCVYKYVYQMLPSVRKENDHHIQRWFVRGRVGEIKREIANLSMYVCTQSSLREYVWVHA